MGLFEKKTEVVIAFVGKYTQRVSSLQERAIMNTYRARLQSLVHQHYPGVSRYQAWFFKNWTGSVFSASTLRQVAEEGIYIGNDFGEIKELHDAIEKVLILEYRVMKSDYHPTVVLETIDPYTGIFVVLCKMKVKESKLN